ncbi:class I SAM-dependent methyltransferase [bacterium]|nr:class I SAM-dependent methyltransferase [bacterium]
MEDYQSRWINGEEIAGVRECADRYEIIRKYAERFDRPFTVLDIGANYGYFSIRLMEDFDCVSVMGECVPQYFEELTRLVDANGCDKGIVFKHRFSQHSLRQLAEVEHFDLVLAMSIVHHIDGDVNETIRLIRNLGDHTIIEVANENNACGQKQVKTTAIGEDWQHLGIGKSHLATSVRDIYAMQQTRTRFDRRYIGCPEGLVAGHRLDSNDNSKTISFDHKSESRDWIPGINLVTFKHYGGIYPTNDRLEETLILMDPPKLPHGDIRPWNLIISGHDLHLIDAADPNHTQITDDAKSIDGVINWLSSGRWSA